MLLEANIGHQKRLHTLFAELLLAAPTNTPFVFLDVHRTPSVCGSDLKPDVVMCLRHKPCIPLSTAAIINLKQQGGSYDNDENVGKAIIYGKVFLQQFPRSLRSTVVVGLTDLISITLILVRLHFNGEGNEELSFDMSHRLPDVKHTLLQLLSSHPQDLFVKLPDLGASIRVIGFLGYGATSHVYEALEGDQQVMSLRVCSVGVLSKIGWFLSHVQFQLTQNQHMYNANACKFAYGCPEYVCQVKQFCLLQAFSHSNEVAHTQGLCKH